jgi:hypothetical protein
MNGLGFSVARVLEGIDAAAAAGLPVKVNCVVQRGVNEGGVLDLCAYFRERGHVLRFIEFMDVGTTNHWLPAQVVPSRELVERVAAVWPLEPLGPLYRGEVAARYRYADGRGEIGIISSVTEPFCRRLPPGAPLGRWPALHLPLCRRRHRPPRPRALGRRRHGGRREGGRRLGARSDRYSEERAALPPAPRPRGSR